MRSLGDSDPRQVGAYRVLAGLGGDEMGPVVLGWGPGGRLVAVKTVAGRLVADGGFGLRFVGEVAALRRVTGGHTVPVVDAGPGDAAPWVAVEFLPGPSLRQMVERGVLLGEDALLRLAAGIATALSEIHRVGLVHRDLTPVNVLLTEGGVRVLDFGIARAVDRDVSQVVGSAEFMSPEQAGGQAVAAASDVFSLGALLHFAATGRSPFVGATRNETLTHVVRTQPELSMSLPPRVRHLLSACLVKEPGQRPTADQLLMMIGVVPPVAQPWPPLVQSMIVEQQAAVGRLVAASRPRQPQMGVVAQVDAPTVRIAVPPRRRTAAPRSKSVRKRWRPDRWAVVSGAAIVVTIVFAIVMFNLLTPDQPITESRSSVAVPTTTTTTSTMTTTTTVAPEPPYGEVVGLAEKCVDVAGASTENGAAVQLHECNGTEAQQWEFAEDGTVQALGKCMDVTGGHANDGATVQIYDCNGTGAQQWVVTPEGWIFNVQAEKCLDVPASKTDDGTQLVIWTCHGEANQVWAPPA